MARTKDFEDFLVDCFADKWNGLDDEFIDDCNNWIDGLDTDDLMIYAEAYGKLCYQRGQVEAYNRSMELIKGLQTA